MNEYIERIIRCGVAAHEAIRLYKSFLKEFSIEDLEDYIASVERDNYVARIELESH